MDAHENPAVLRRERIACENPPRVVVEPKPMQRMSARADDQVFKPTERIDMDDIAEYAREHPARDDQ